MEPAMLKVLSKEAFSKMTTEEGQEEIKKEQAGNAIQEALDI